LAPEADGISHPTPPVLVAEVLTPTADARLIGRAVTLRDVLASVAGRQQQLNAARAYWQLVEAVGEYHYAEAHHRQLQAVAASPLGATRLTAALASAAALVQEAKMAAIAAQHELAAAALLDIDTPAPLPADRPHAGPYRTNYDSLFAAKTAPAHVTRIDRTLPIRWQTIEVRARAVAATDAAAREATDAHAAGRSDVAALLTAAEDALTQRRAFIRSVCDYNQQIAHYALSTADPAADAGALVAMLIEPADSSGNAPTSADPAVQPAGHQEPVLPPNTPVADPQMGTLPHVANRPIDEPTEVSVAPALYPALVDATPDDQARQLTSVLHWDFALPEETGQKLSLAECLAGRVRGDRRELVDAFWIARQRAAEYQVLRQQAGWLEGISLTVEGAGQPLPSSLRSAVGAARAAAEEARLAMLDARFEVATRLGRVSDAAWPIPSTAPHAGQYALKLDAQPRQLTASWPMRRLAELVPGLAETLKRRATAVVEADVARAAATTGWESGQRPLALVLDGVGRQTQQTLAYLQTLTDYNRAIAEYALTVLPPGTPNEQVVGALVLP